MTVRRVILLLCFFTIPVVLLWNCLEQSTWKASAVELQSDRLKAHRQAVAAHIKQVQDRDRSHTQPTKE